MFDKIKIQKHKQNYGVYEHIDDDKDYYLFESFEPPLAVGICRKISLWVCSN